MNTSATYKTVTPRKHPLLAEMFRKSEGKHFTDEELELIEKEYPDLKTAVEATKEIRLLDVKIINRVVKEIFAQYDYEKFHQFSSPKCTRDVRYVVIYATHCMLARDPKWFEDKLLIWFKTILQAFEFPERTQKTGSALFADPVLEERLKQLPKKAQSIFHTYYRLHQEVGKSMKPEHFALLGPYLEMATNVLSEKH